MIQKCCLCEKPKNFDSALVIVRVENEKQVTKPMPVCQNCRKTEPLFAIYQAAKDYLKVQVNE